MPDNTDEIAGLGMEVEQEDNDEPLPTEITSAREHSNVVSVKEATCTCGKWQAYKYPCHHAIVYYDCISAGESGILSCMTRKQKLSFFVKTTQAG